MPRVPAADTGTVKKDLLARLGLPAFADEETVDATHAQIVSFLDSAPAEISGWASRRRAEADRVVELLSGSEESLAAVSQPAVLSAPSPRRPVPKPLLFIGGAVLAVAVIWGVYQIGNPNNGSLPTMTSAQNASTPSPSIDPAKVAELMKKIQANPQDTESLLALADLYYNIGDFKTARSFLDKILAYDPKNLKALIGAGAASYNGGEPAAAEKPWTDAAKYYPNEPEVHYDLGFLYMTTGRTDLMKAEWAKVVELAPDSQMAANVQQHVSGTKSSASPSAAVTPSATPTK